MKWHTDLLETSLGTDYILRAVSLRKSGKLPIVLVIGGKRPMYFLSEDRADPWGGKRFISHEALRTMIDALDAENAPVQRIGPKSVYIARPVTKFALRRISS